MQAARLCESTRKPQRDVGQRRGRPESAGFGVHAGLGHRFAVGFDMRRRSAMRRGPIAPGKYGFSAFPHRTILNGPVLGSARMALWSSTLVGRVRQPAQAPQRSPRNRLGWAPVRAASASGRIAASSKNVKYWSSNVWAGSRTGSVVEASCRRRASSLLHAQVTPWRWPCLGAGFRVGGHVVVASWAGCCPRERVKRRYTLYCMNLDASGPCTAIAGEARIQRKITYSLGFLSRRTLVHPRFHPRATAAPRPGAVVTGRGRAGRAGHARTALARL